MKTPFKEQETIIRWYREDEEATIYTSDYTMMTRFVLNGSLNKTSNSPGLVGQS